jgi:hypothetical protein
MKPEHAGRADGQFVMVTHHDMGNFGKMTKGKWWQNGISRLCKDYTKKFRAAGKMPHE